jgi:hypothetical protein
LEKKMRLKRKYSALKRKIDKLGFITTGSLMKVYKTCGNAGCRCHKDKSKRHGPYNIWTRKVNAKTVTRTLTDEQAVLARKCIDNMRKFEKIAQQMKDLSVQYIENHGNNFNVDKNRQKL